MIRTRHPAAILAAILAAAAALLLSGPAQAEESCEMLDRACARRLLEGCLARPGASASSLSAGDACWTDRKAYQSCMAKVVARCGAPVGPPLWVGAPRDIGAGVLAGEIGFIAWLHSDALALRRVADANRVLVAALAGLDTRLVYLDLGVDLARAEPDQAIAKDCVKAPEAHDLFDGGDHETNRKIFLPSRRLTEGPCKGMLSSGGGFAIIGEPDAYSAETVPCGAECARLRLAGFFSVAVADAPHGTALRSDGESILRPSITLEAYDVGPQMRGNVAKAVGEEVRKAAEPEEKTR